MAKRVDAGNVAAERDLNEMISKTAYELYEKRGRVSGYDFDDWIEAEGIVKKQFEKVKKSEAYTLAGVSEKMAAGRGNKRKAASP